VEPNAVSNAINYAKHRSCSHDAVIRAHERALCIGSINSLFRDGADLDYISARGWKAFEAPGVEPVFPKKDHAIDYAQGRACFRLGEIRVLD
jgi:hypothetical protein